MKSPTFGDKLARGSFVCTADLLPPRGPGAPRLDPDVVAGLRRLGCAVNVADMPSAVLAQAPLAGALQLLAAGLEPILQVTGRDRNRLALQADLLAAHALGGRNLLCLTGDHPAFGDHPGARPVFDLSATGILAAVAALNDGRSLEGRPLEGKTAFVAGAALNPGQIPPEPQLARAVAKERAGAAFFQTQPLFTPHDAARALAAAAEAGLGAPVLVGTFLLESSAMARYMAERVPGVTIPGAIVAGLEAAADPRAYGRDLARELVSWVSETHEAAVGEGAAGEGAAGDGAVSGEGGGARPVRPPRPAGVHVMSLNRLPAVIELLDGALGPG
ncbi:MAG: methylenetetrahydrofolate reductase [Thermoleophilia bacterium]